MDMTNNICIKYQCSECCNPVKISLCQSLPNLHPFIFNNEILISENNIDYAKLRSYRCSHYNSKTGLCDDYLNRPEICKNTRCLAFYTNDNQEQFDIINQIKLEKFIVIKY